MNSVVINTGVDSCRICVMSRNDGGVSLYQVYHDVYSISFSDISEPCDICITKPGYVPYVATYQDTMYIQNETIDDNRIFIARQIIGGDSVTTSIPYGPVIIENGKVKIFGTDGVEIFNSFEVQTGAELEINP